MTGCSYESLADCMDFSRCLLHGNDKENHETCSSNATSSHCPCVYLITPPVLINTTDCEKKRRYCNHMRFLLLNCNPGENLQIWPSPCSSQHDLRGPYTVGEELQHMLFQTTWGSRHQVGVCKKLMNEPKGHF